MAKFCTKCGKKLEEGQVCNCSKAENKKTTKKVVVEESTKIDFKESAMDCLNIFKKIFTKPVEAIKEFVVENKFIAGIIMILVTALSAGLYRIATLKSIYSSSSASSFNANDIANLISGALSGGMNSTEPEYLKEFFTVSFTNIAQFALIVLLGWVIISKLMKGTATWKQMITAVAVSLSVVLVSNLINSVLVFIDGDFIGNIRSYVASFASIFSNLVLFVSIKEIAGIDKNKAFTAVASMCVVATVVIDIVQKLFD